MKSPNDEIRIPNQARMMGNDRSGIRTLDIQSTFVFRVSDLSAILGGPGDLTDEGKEE